MKKRPSPVDLPILVFPPGAKVPLAKPLDPSIHNGLTLHAAFDPPPHSTPRDRKKRGEAAEAAFLARATYLGFSVLHPWGDSNRYDAAVDLGRMILRVQVKSAASLQKKGGYAIRATGANGHIYTVKEIDFMVGYIVPENIWYIIPVEAVRGRGSIEFRPHSRRRVKPIFERYREAWCLLDCPRKKRGWKDIPVLCRCREVGVQCAVCPLKGS